MRTIARGISICRGIGEGTTAASTALSPADQLGSPRASSSGGDIGAIEARE